MQDAACSDLPAAKKGHVPRLPGALMQLRPLAVGGQNDPQAPVLNQVPETLRKCHASSFVSLKLLCIYLNKLSPCQYFCVDAN